MQTINLAFKINEKLIILFIFFFFSKLFPYKLFHGRFWHVPTLKKLIIPKTVNIQILRTAESTTTLWYFNKILPYRAQFLNILDICLVCLGANKEFFVLWMDFSTLSMSIVKLWTLKLRCKSSWMSQKSSCVSNSAYHGPEMDV